MSTREKALQQQAAPTRIYLIAQKLDCRAVSTPKSWALEPNSDYYIGAAEKTRTSTPVKEQRPQRYQFNNI